MTAEPANQHRRYAPKAHLAAAAKSDLGSDLERYHLAAAAAEALTRLDETLRSVDVWLSRLCTVLAERFPKP